MIKILDCTLRDGGYNNNWEFGAENIKKIYNGLIESQVDIIECGFITQNIKYEADKTLYDTVNRVTEFYYPYMDNSSSVCMINYGEFDITNLSNHKDGDIDGIRLAFHKKDMVPALEYCKRIIEKGYKLFIQPMVCMSYSDAEFIELINLSNEIKPFAFYIVDSFGVMKKNDLVRFFLLVDHNLDKSISIGFHSHNNLQLSYSHAQTLLEINNQRDIIIDSSVMGMGRGAGNLNTELFTQHLNEKLLTSYKTDPLLKIVDEILAPIYYHNFWGYSLPHYLSAVHNCHPNYATFLDDKNTLKISDINNILSSIPIEKKINYDKILIEELYIGYQSTKQIFSSNNIALIQGLVRNKNILIIAPGNSIKEEEDKIIRFISNNDIITFSVNFIPPHFEYNYLFVSNLKRFEQIKGKSYKNLIITSNIINYKGDAIIVNYSELLNDNASVIDNAGLMLIKLLIKLEASKIFLAGFDGYSQSIYENFAEKDLAFIKKEDTMKSMNDGMSSVLRDYRKLINIEFLTKEHFITI